VGGTLPGIKQSRPGKRKGKQHCSAVYHGSLQILVQTDESIQEGIEVGNAQPAWAEKSCRTRKVHKKNGVGGKNVKDEVVGTRGDRTMYSGRGTAPKEARPNVTVKKGAMKGAKQEPAPSRGGRRHPRRGRHKPTVGATGSLGKEGNGHTKGGLTNG